jgi:hypothetical protein
MESRRPVSAHPSRRLQSSTGHCRGVECLRAELTCHWSNRELSCSALLEDCRKYPSLSRRLAGGHPLAGLDVPHAASARGRRRSSLPEFGKLLGMLPQHVKQSSADLHLQGAVLQEAI